MDLDVVTINSKDPYKDLLQFVEEAFGFFPFTVWDTVNYIGETEFSYDNKFLVDGKPIQAFHWKQLFLRLKNIKRKKPLLGITSNLVYMERTEYHDGRFITNYTAVHEYMSETGFISLFKLEKQVVSKVMAHALGHNRGLEHHTEPIDLMYMGLIHNTYVPEKFCKKCKNILSESI